MQLHPPPVGDALLSELNRGYPDASGVVSHPHPVDHRSPYPVPHAARSREAMVSELAAKREEIRMYQESELKREEATRILIARVQELQSECARLVYERDRARSQANETRAQCAHLAHRTPYPPHMQASSAHGSKYDMHNAASAKPKAKGKAKAKSKKGNVNEAANSGRIEGKAGASEDKVDGRAGASEKVIRATLQKSADSKLGIEVDASNGSSLLIEDINTGLVESWNATVGAQRDTKIKEGDHIIEVNGIRHDPQKMVSELSTKQKLVMVIMPCKNAGSSPA